MQAAGSSTHIVRLQHAGHPAPGVLRHETHADPRHHRLERHPRIRQRQRAPTDCKGKPLRSIKRLRSNLQQAPCMPKPVAALQKQHAWGPCAPAARLLLPLDASVSALRRRGKGKALSGGSTASSARSASAECPASRRCPPTEVCGRPGQGRQQWHRLSTTGPDLKASYCLTLIALHLVTPTNQTPRHKRASPSPHGLPSLPLPGCPCPRPPTPARQGTPR